MWEAFRAWFGRTVRRPRFTLRAEVDGRPATVEMLDRGRVRATVACATPVSALVRVAGPGGGVPVLPGVVAVGRDPGRLAAVFGRPRVRDALAALFAFAPADARVELGPRGVVAVGSAEWLADDTLEDGLEWLAGLARAVEGHGPPPSRVPLESTIVRLG